MPINILMPALSPTMEKGNLAKWLKKEGDAVKTGDVIAEIETDKATMEVESVDDGVMAKIVVPEGTNDVPVNQLIAVLAQEGEDPKAAAEAAGKGTPAAKAPTAATPSPPPSPARGEGAIQQAAAPSAGAQSSSKEAKSPSPQPPPAVPSPQRGEGGGEGIRTNGHAPNRVFSSPLARRLAKEAGIDIGRIQGSGPHGRVIARDVAAAKEGKGLRAPAAAPGAPAAAAAPTIAPSMSDQQIRALYEDGSYELVPHDGMRRTIAQRLTASIQTIPHFYLTVDCDIGKLVAAREEINIRGLRGRLALGLSRGLRRRPRGRLALGLNTMGQQGQGRQPDEHRAGCHLRDRNVVVLLEHGDVSRGIDLPRMRRTLFAIDISGNQCSPAPRSFIFPRAVGGSRAS